jgi:hypothetical protein
LSLIEQHDLSTNRAPFDRRIEGHHSDSSDRRPLTRNSGIKV